MNPKRLAALGLFALLCTSATAAELPPESPASDGTPWGRDPFRYPASAAADSAANRAADESPAEPAGPGLQGIFVHDGVRRALIDGKLLGPGDRVGSLHIRAVHLYEIDVEDMAGRRTIELFPSHQGEEKR